MHYTLHERCDCHWCLHYDRCSFSLHVNVSGPCKLYLSYCPFTTLQGSLLLSTFLFSFLFKNKHILYIYIYIYIYMLQRNILLTFLNLIIFDNRQNYLWSRMHELYMRFLLKYTYVFVLIVNVIIVKGFLKSCCFMSVTLCVNFLLLIWMLSILPYSVNRFNKLRHIRSNKR